MSEYQIANEMGWVLRWLASVATNLAFSPIELSLINIATRNVPFASL